MKVTLLCAWSILLLAHHATAQCDTHRQRDEFTGKTMVYTGKVKIIKQGESPILKSFDKTASDKCFFKDYLQFILIDGTASIALTEESDMCGCQMQKIEFKFADGSVLIKSNAKEGHFTQKECTGEQIMYFELTRDELMRFANSGIDKVRITNEVCSDHQVVKDEIDDKPAATIQKNAACILKMVWK